MLKPSCVQRGFIGEVISRFEKKGLKIIQLKVEKLSREKAENCMKFIGENHSMKT